MCLGVADGWTVYVPMDPTRGQSAAVPVPSHGGLPCLPFSSVLKVVPIRFCDGCTPCPLNLAHFPPKNSFSIKHLLPKWRQFLDQSLFQRTPRGCVTLCAVLRSWQDRASLGPAVRACACCRVLRSGLGNTSLSNSCPTELPPLCDSGRC